MNKTQQSTIWTWESYSSAAFSPRGDRIALGNGNGQLCVRNAYDGKHVVQPFKAHTLCITCVGYSCDGTRIVTGSIDATLSVWNAIDGTCITGPFKGHAAHITSVAFSTDDAYIASGSHDCTIHIWSSHDVAIPGRQLAGHMNQVTSVAFSPKGMHIVSSSLDSTLRIWDIFSGTTIFTLHGHCGSVLLAQFTPDGNNIISFSPYASEPNQRCEMFIWDASIGSLCGKLNDLQFCPIQSIAISPEGDCVAGSVNHSISVWDRQTGELVAGPFEGRESIQSIKFSDDSTRIISVSMNQTVRVWNMYAGGKAGDTESLPQGTPGPNCETLAFVPNQSRIALCGPTDIQAVDLDLHTTTYITGQLDSPIVVIQFSLDGTRIYSVHATGTMCTWNANTAQLIGDPRRCSSHDQVISAACSVDGTHIVTYTHNRPDHIELWDIRFDQGITFCKMNHRGHRSDATIIFSQGCRRFLGSSADIGQGAIDVWDVIYGTHVAGPFSKCRALDFSPDGTQIICWSATAQVYRTLCVINVSSGEYIPLIGMSTAYLYPSEISARFSPDGLYVACVMHNSCCIWNAHDQTVLSTLTHPNTILKSIGYSPNGWCLASSFYNLGDKKVSQIWRLYIDSFKPTSIDIGTSPGGWVLDSQSRSMFWVPTVIQDEFPLNSGLFVLNGETLYVNYDDMFVGDDWSKCYIGG
ncbi:hypothetical protein FRC11_006716 [Ceratobasidium sp. 423]|nr:hypothetical protein FRC11_006716 [Ceratobasidium sp. 423]